MQTLKIILPAQEKTKVAPQVAEEVLQIFLEYIFIVRYSGQTLLPEQIIWSSVYYIILYNIF